MKCTELLAEDHRAMLRALDVLDEMSSRIERGERVDAADIEALLNFMRVFGDEYHQAKEESALFPVLRRTVAAEEPAVRHMLFEHDQERSLVAGLEDALRTRQGPDFVYFANRLSALLRNHIYKEEHILFDVVDKCFCKEDDAEVVTEFEKFEAQFPACRNLRTLEAVYMRKTA
jgi:hemerythrin-like domain-containing protein